MLLIRNGTLRLSRYYVMIDRSGDAGKGSGWGFKSKTMSKPQIQFLEKRKSIHLGGSALELTKNPGFNLNYGILLYR